MKTWGVTMTHSHAILLSVTGTIKQKDSSFHTTLQHGNCLLVITNLTDHMI